MCAFYSQKNSSGDDEKWNCHSIDRGDIVAVLLGVNRLLCTGEVFNLNHWKRICVERLSFMLFSLFRHRIMNNDNVSCVDDGAHGSFIWESVYTFLKNGFVMKFKIFMQGFFIIFCISCNIFHDNKIVFFKQLVADWWGQLVAKENKLCDAYFRSSSLSPLDSWMSVAMQFETFNSCLQSTSLNVRFEKKWYFWQLNRFEQTFLQVAGMDTFS